MNRETDVASEPVTSLEWAAQLRATLHDRAALLEELEAIGERQDALVAALETEGLMQLLASRQGLVDRFVAGHAELLAMTGSIEERLLELPEDEAAALRTGVRAIGTALDRLTARDERTQALLRRLREETREELRRTDRAGDARAAYARRSGGQPLYADRRG